MEQNEFCLLPSVSSGLSYLVLKSALHCLRCRVSLQSFFFFFLVSHLKAEYAPPLEKSHQTMMTVPRIMNRALVVTFSVDIVTFSCQYVREGYFYKNTHETRF